MMKIILPFLIFMLILVYTTHGVNLDPKIVEGKFQLFKQIHSRHYANKQEEILRRRIFQNKLEHIENHNQRFKSGLETYEIEVNKFSDLTEEEFLNLATGLKIPDNQPKPLFSISSSSQLSKKVKTPDSVDWRSQGVVNPVKNQGRCGSCWAFSAVGALESHFKIRDGPETSISLSEQQLVDCVPHGCKGGLTTRVFNYIAANNSGINYDWDYPYEGKDGNCRYDSTKSHISIQGHATITAKDENLLKDAVANVGPVSVSINAGGNFGSYKDGVYYNPDCGTKTNHAVVIVGYGTENEEDYWLVRNSWGANWGLGGYIKMARNRGNNCNIASYSSWPVL